MRTVEHPRCATLVPAWMHAWFMTVPQTPFAAPLCMILSAPVGLASQVMGAHTAAGVSAPSTYSQVLHFVVFFCMIFDVFIPVPSDLIEPELVAGCDSNRECPDYTACRNSRCINPCAVDDPCAPSASCKVIGHEPVCTCPDGYIGDPRTRCERKI